MYKRQGLMVDFGPVGKVRASILQVVESLSPKGMTPIGYSLREAAKDFPQGKDGRNVIVLVTDGEESCLATVSYTHLDVYKRQTDRSSTDCPSADCFTTDCSTTELSATDFALRKPGIS